MNKTDKKHTILVVDDTSENIDVLRGILGHKFKVKVALNGEKALKIAEAKDPPDIILLDIMMPEMDGYEVCRRLKANALTKRIPVIFVTAKGEIEDETKGFQLGAVDYITKPVSPPVVMERVKTHLDLQDSRKQVEQLLSKTLMGSIKLLTDILALVNPQAFSQAGRLKKYAGDIALTLNLQDIWIFEMAALLSQIGCVTIPLDILEKVNMGDPLTIKEKDVFSTHPAVGHDLIANIPRLSLVAKIIEKQQETLSMVQMKGDLAEWDPVTVGGQILKVVADYDKLISLGETSRSSIVELKNRGGIYVPDILQALSQTQSDGTETIEQSVHIDDLKEGMILSEDIETVSGMKLFNKRSEVNGNMLKLIQRYSTHRKIKQPILVQISDD